MADRDQTLKDDRLETEEVEYRNGADTVRAFLCRPKAAGQYPGVIVIHEIFGLTEHIKDVSCRLAGAGYVALAPDLYTREGDAAETADFTKLRELVGKIADARIVGDLQAGMAYLRTRSDVGGDRIGSVGFCMGGLYSLLLAGRTPDLKAAVSFYGRLVYPEKTAEKPAAPNDLAPEMTAAIQGHYGGADQGIPVETVEQFRVALQKHGKTAEIYIYPAAPHAFHNDARPSYRPEDARLAWSRTLAWFEKHLKGSTQHAARSTQHVAETEDAGPHGKPIGRASAPRAARRVLRAGSEATMDPRLCIVGAGSLSTRRIYPYLGAAGAQLVGVCDLDRERAERNARRFGGTAYDDMERMLAAEQPDGVILCIGPREHAELAPVVMRHGIPVYTEKPPALDAAAALAVARVSRETGVLCTTAFKKRYSRAYSRARQWIETFAPEDLLSISIDYASGPYRDEDDRNGFLLDFAIHIIDLAGFLFGEARQVFAFAKERHAYAVSLRFANGAVGSLNLTDGRSFGVPTEEVEITVRGGNFMTIHNSSCWRITQGEKPCEWREPPTFISAGDSGYETGHLAEIEEFVAAIREGRSTRSNILESYKSMVLYEAIRESARTEQVVKVSYEG